MKNFFGTVVLFVTLFVGTVADAQNASFVQIEAHTGLRDAQNRARAWSGVFTDVNGLRMRSGWYAITLGPYSEEGALRRMQTLKDENLIPADSFVSVAQDYRQQFWPVGATVLTTPVDIAPEAPAAASEPEVTAPDAPASEPEVAEAPEPAPAPAVSDETPRQARQSESALSREERKLLQIALKWDGFYNSAIDGAFGRGTRAAMAAWQDAKGYEPSGVLTTAQRQKLIDDYNAVLSSVGMRAHENTAAGISLDLPLAFVSEARTEPPFIQFEPQTPEGARVLLISQAGTQATLHGLFDIMQTLEIVPAEGPRSKNGDSFTLTGENADIISTTWAHYSNGEVKGFTLVWPAGDERRRARVFQAMRDSFVSHEGKVLDDTSGEAGEDQRIDLLAGLELRQPEFSRSGFFVDDRGTIVTTSEIGGQCREITLDRDQTAEIVFSDEALGIAILRPQEALSPRSYVSFRDGPAKIRSDIVIAGFPFEGVLEQPTLTFGRLEDIRGLSGENTLQRLSLFAEPGDSGGPVFDQSGNVIGMLLPASSPAGQKLPEIVRFSARSNALSDLLAANGITSNIAEATPAMAPENLTTLAGQVTVLVSCWN